MSYSEGAVRDLLEQLQVATIEELLNRIASGEATAAELNTARQLCKDNEVVVLLGESDENPIKKLQLQITDADIERAM